MKHFKVFDIIFEITVGKFVNVTGPAKAGNVNTNYTPLHYRSYFSSETDYFHSVNCIIKPIKC